MEMKAICETASKRYRKAALTAMKSFAAWAQKNAVTVFPVSTGCCCSFGQLQQEGEKIVFNPHHADVLVVGGALNHKAAAVIRRIYDQMPSPKYVIAWGCCAADGGLFSGSYAVARIEDVVPVDVFIPGCPPDAAAVAEGMAALRRIIRKKSGEG